MRSEQREQIGTYPRSDNLRRCRISLQERNMVIGAIERDITEGVASFTPLLQIQKRSAITDSPSACLFDLHYLPGVFVWQRPQQYTVDNREHRTGGPQTKSERPYYRDRKTR